MDLRPRLALVRAPALIVVGDRDLVASPKAAARLHLGLAGSKLLLVEDAGHFPWLEQPAAFFGDFLDALGVRARQAPAGAEATAPAPAGGRAVAVVECVRGISGRMHCTIRSSGTWALLSVRVKISGSSALSCQ